MKTIKDKIQDLKYMIEDPHEPGYIAELEIEVEWGTSDWKDYAYSYGSMDPADKEDEFVASLGKYCFKAVDGLTEIAEDLNREKDRHEEILGVLAEAVAKLQNTIDDLLITNSLQLTLNHSESALENKLLLEAFWKDASEERADD